MQRAREVLGPFLPVFAGAPAGPAALREEMTRWAREVPAVAEWVAAFAPGGDAGSALAGTVMAWSLLQGVVSQEVQGQFSGMGHDPATLLAAHIDSLADAMGL
ncbi:hypothetical protein HNP84_009424 [Thermocatellispora tengchongensis]|uniref:HTH-type transcriptional regulator MT1864/Rv1816-like C-terminal domain-containing protein n=1 Tax=Thermocatellispora tengchongensis TaxID=1073253 RepID=A0A840PPK5_9ACTN|nr:TetR-like C-terminal domain-containing protein [Thermocatellispora tengchongensis]MBB5139660.1 hypothetical protein [Thermocatellispora tengchongensis]